MIKSTFSILFLIRKSRLGKSGESSISMRITVNGRFTEMSTLRKVLANLWDSKKERAVAGYLDLDMSLCFYLMLYKFIHSGCKDTQNYANRSVIAGIKKKPINICDWLLTVED